MTVKAIHWPISQGAIAIQIRPGVGRTLAALLELSLCGNGRLAARLGDEKSFFASCRGVVLGGFREYASSSVEGFRHAKANILPPEMAVKSCLLHTLRWLFPGSAKNEFSSRFVHLVGEFLQCLKASGIDRSHVPEPQDNDGGKLVQTRNNRIELICCAEEKGAMDSEDADVGGDFFVLQDMSMTFSNVFCRHF